MRLLIHLKSGSEWFVEDRSRTFHTPYGPVGPELLAKRTRFSNASGHEFVLVSPGWADRLRHLKRVAQVILPKDAAQILAMTGVDKRTVAIDCGGGSGWLTVFLALHCKHVYSYDLSKEHLACIKKNVVSMGLKNITVEKRDIYDGLPVRCDLLTLDVPEPWRVIPLVRKKMPVGSHLVCYTPSITQAQGAVNAAEKEGFVVRDVQEVNVRSWDIDRMRARPKKEEIGPTGFLSFIRIV